MVLLEAETVAFGASGRNGGFMESSLTHGLANGLARWPEEMAAIERMGHENYDGIVETLRRHGIDCGLEENGVLAVATEPHQVPWLAEEVETHRAHGFEAVLLDRDAVRAEVDSPTYEAGLWMRGGNALVDPARLARGLAEAATGAGRRAARAHARRRRSAPTAPGSWPRRRTAACARAARCWPRAPSRRSCAPSGATSCRSTTTCS